MADWFYAAGDDRVGPVTEEELAELARIGAVQPTTLVWTEGAADWAAARAVPWLFPPSAPPAAGSDGQPLLQYASAGLVNGSVAPAPFAPPPPDAGPFFKLGRRFSIEKQRWTGRAIVSPQAIYLFKQRRLSYQAYGVGGLIGMAMAAAASRSDELTRSCDITELPDAIRRQFDPKRKRKRGDIVVLNRDAMNLVKTSGWTSSITPHLGAEKFPVTTRLFGINKARAFMRDHGWTLDLLVQPTAAPTHGRGYGLDDTAVQRRRSKSTWIRIGWAALAIALVTFIVAVQLLAHR